ncbi:hypothetical protein [Spiroplasma endosymbiont of Virgichneumon dumeticola]|uniref:hypothetical protein n=1 Tax=Spiroplasma endosymbiont of Virgichneumon dumeticola TaxID=3139323 RepID=UPI0035C88871
MTFCCDYLEKNKAFLSLCTIFKFYHINAEKSLSTDFSPHFKLNIALQFQN